MSQQFNNTPGLSLPQPTLEASEPVAQVPEIPQTPTPDLTAPRPEIAPQPVQPVMQMPPMPQSQPVAPVQQPIPTPAPVTSAQPTTNVSVSDEPEDEDAIDEEWVNKAKAIVEQTHTDPYAESVALSRVKAEYLQQRHGKTIKVNDKA